MCVRYVHSKEKTSIFAQEKKCPPPLLPFFSRDPQKHNFFPTRERTGHTSGLLETEYTSSHTV